MDRAFFGFINNFIINSFEKLSTKRFQTILREIFLKLFLMLKLVKKKNSAIRIIPILLLVLILIIAGATTFFIGKKNNIGEEKTEASSAICSNIKIEYKPNKPLYKPGEVVKIIIKGIDNTHGDLSLHFTRSTSNTKKSESWDSIENPVYNNQTGNWEAEWTVTNSINAPFPYSQSDYQEFIIAANLINNGHFICTGNPDPGIVPGYPEIQDVMCENCYKYLISSSDENIAFVTNSKRNSLIESMSDYWNVNSGYSLTYEGKRPDGPFLVNGIEVEGNFEGRMEYEAPIAMCGNKLIPQRFTKTNKWGYWGPADKDPVKRASWWFNGLHNLRFFLTLPGDASNWDGEYFGAFGHKIYDVQENEFSLGDNLGTFQKTFVHTGSNLENKHYPPYLLSLAEVPQLGSPDIFVRADTLHYALDGNIQSEREDIICNESENTEEHKWFLKSSILPTSNTQDDPELAEILESFNNIKSYFGEKEIVLLTFFEATHNSKPTFREDWYLMKDVGLVGIDQSFWSADDQDITAIYFSRPYMTSLTEAKPHMSMRAARGYLGEQLDIKVQNSFVSTPSNSTVIQRGNSYILTAKSSVTGMPYDGYLAVNGNEWKSAIDGKPLWIENGKVVVEIPANFPVGTYNAKFTPWVTKTPSEFETQLPFEQMPESNEITVSVN